MKSLSIIIPWLAFAVGQASAQTTDLPPASTDPTQIQQSNGVKYLNGGASEDDRARGIETYFLNFAPNPAAEAIAARENAASARTMRQLPDIVKAIALNNKIDESRDFASLVQSAIMERLKRDNGNVKDLGVKQAPFMVLIGATMPSILAEISFLTNPQEAVLLRGTTYRQQIAEALFNGIMRYQRSLKTDATVASQ